MAEGRYAKELVQTATPEQVFERRWAFTVLEEVVDLLGREYADAGKTTLFAQLKPFLGGAADTASYRDIAATLGMTEGAVQAMAGAVKSDVRNPDGNPPAVA